VYDGLTWHQADLMLVMTCSFVSIPYICGLIMLCGEIEGLHSLPVTYVSVCLCAGVPRDRYSVSVR